MKAQLALLERNAKNYALAIKLFTECHAQLAALPTPDQQKLQIIAVHLAATYALMATPENHASAKQLLEDIGPIDSDLVPVTRATEALTMALISAPRDKQMHLNRLAILLETLGSDGLWLRKQWHIATREVAVKR
jgi:hypothetical protein